MDAGGWVAVSEIAPWLSNPRRNDKAVAGVAASIKRFGFGAPIVANWRTREVIAGHTRLLAAKRLGLAVVPVRWLDLSDAEAHALALADNKLGEVASWETAKLADEVCRLVGAGVEVDGLGWSSEELRALGVGCDAIDDGAFDGLATGEPEVRQLSFNLTAAQLAQVQAAIAAARRAAGVMLGESAAVVAVCRSFVEG